MQAVSQPARKRPPRPFRMASPAYAPSILFDDGVRLGYRLRQAAEFDIGGPEALGPLRVWVPTTPTSRTSVSLCVGRSSASVDTTSPVVPEWVAQERKAAPEGGIRQRLVPPTGTAARIGDI
jgi:hypothetical protein